VDEDTIRPWHRLLNTHAVRCNDPLCERSFLALLTNGVISVGDVSKGRLARTSTSDLQSERFL
jgi:hypothetical protein